MSEPKKEQGLLRSALAWGEIRRTPYGVTPAAVFVVIGLFSALAGAVGTVALPDIARDLNLDFSVIGGIFATVGLVGLFSAIPLATLADRHSRRWLSGVGTLLSSLATMLASRATSAGTFVTTQVGGRITSEPIKPAAQSLLADYYPVETRGRVFAAIGLSGEAASLVALAVAGVLVSAIGWRTSLLAAEVPVLLGAVIILVFLREPTRGYFEKLSLGVDEEQAKKEDEKVSFGEAWRTVWGVRMARRLFLANIFAGVAGPPLGFLPFLMSDHYGLDAKARGFVSIPVSIAFIAGGVIGGGLIDVLSRRSPSSVLRMVSLSFVALAIPMVFYALQPPLAVFIGAQVFASFVTGFGQPMYLVIYSQIFPARVRTQGLVISTLSLAPGQILVGTVYAAILTLYGFPAMFLATIPPMLLSAIFAYSVADFYEGDRRNAILASAADEEVRRAAEAGLTKLLVCRGVNVFYEGNQVLFGVDFEVEAGEILALLGTNGAGKSTLLRAISGTQAADDGAILLDGRDITHMPPAEIVQHGAVLMPGGRGVFPGLTVDENLRLATWLTPDGAADAVEAAYERFPVLRQRRSESADVLSGGEQQMLSLAQAFLSRPKLLMIDELSLGLSPAVVGQLLDAVREINALGTTIIVVEQSVNVALSVAGRAVFMEKGEIRFSGPAETLLQRPDILRAVYVKGTASMGAKTEHRAIETEAPARPPILEARGITKNYGGVRALSAVDVELEEGQILGIVGPNGSGKTTLFDVISGYQAPDGGVILFNGEEVNALTAEERARRGLVRRFQDARLFPSMTVVEALQVALDKEHGRGLVSAAARLPRARRAERAVLREVDALVERMGLGSYRAKFIRELSTGVRRIVDLAWVLATDPKVLLLDEPTSGVAQSEAEALIPLLLRVRAETNCSILLIEHDIPVITAVADELVAMASGEVLTRGPADEVLAHERVVEAFLGSSEAAVKRSGAR